MATLAQSRGPAEERAAHPVPEAIERYFQISLFLLIITGFITLASTGKLDLFSVIFVLGALTVRAIHLTRNQQVVIPERWTTVFTLLYVLVYAVDYFFISRDFVSATVHLVLFGMVVKVFSIHRDRDLLYLGVLSFLMILAASVLTVNTVFLAGFALFLLVAIATFISFEMRRSAKAADAVQEISEQRSRFRSRVPGVNTSLSRTALGLSLTILVASTIFFFALPRITGGYLGALTRGSDPVSGLRDTIQLGQIGVIQQSSQVVMHLQIEGDHSAFDGKLRGSILTRFDGKTWTDTPRYMNVLHSQTGRFDVSNETIVADPYLENIGRKIPVMPYRVMMEPTLSTVLFLAKGTVEIDGNFRQIAFDSAQSYLNLDGAHPTNTYWAVANVTPADPNELRTSGSEYPARVVSRYLQLPKVDPRIIELARNVTANAPTPYDKARAIENYLQSNYAYTLELPKTVPADPLANFLFERRQGHCEYFASAMAIMLRTLGIPTRVATGFRVGEFNDLTGSYIVRARDAHAWVEVFFPNQGWTTFDPTAYAVVANTSVLSRLRMYADAMNQFWHEWVVNYDFAHQRTLTASLTNQTMQTEASLRERFSNLYQTLLQRVRTAQEDFRHSPRRQSQWAISVLVLLLVGALAPQLYRTIQAYRVAANPQRAPEAAASVWFARATRHLARFGWTKLPAQTPIEFVRSIDDARTRAIFEEFVTEYEQARFGHSAMSAARLGELFSQLKVQERPRESSTAEMLK